MSDITNAHSLWMAFRADFDGVGEDYMSDITNAQVEAIIKEATTKGSTKQTTAREAIQLTLDAVASELLNGPLNDAAMQQITRVVNEARQVNQTISRASQEIEKLERLVNHAAQMKTLELDESAKNALGLFSSVIDVASRTLTASNSHIHRLSEDSQIQIIKAASYITWAYLGAGRKPTDTDPES